MSHPGHSLEGSYSSAEVQSVYSIAPTNWERFWLSIVLSLIVCLEQGVYFAPLWNKFWGWNSWGRFHIMFYKSDQLTQYSTVYVGRSISWTSRCRSRRALSGILETQRAVHLGSNPPWSSWVYRLVPKATLFRGMQTGLEAFLEWLGVSGQRPCTRTLLK